MKSETVLKKSNVKEETMRNSRLSDMVDASANKDALGFESAFEDVIKAKLIDRLSDMKIGVAQSMFKANEEVEQVDELSKSTLKNYIKTSAGSMHGSGLVTQSFKDGFHTGDGNNSESGAKAQKKMFKRMDGIRKATDKLAKEDVDQIDELSRKTLASYVSKASGSLANRSHNLGMKKAKANEIDKFTNDNSFDHSDRENIKKMAKVTSKDIGKHYDHLEKRSHGILGAAKRLAKEDVDLDESASSFSKDNYEWAHGRRPSGRGYWMFSTVHPRKHDITKHQDKTVGFDDTFTNAAKKAKEHFKSQGHTGDVHVLT